VKKQTAPRRPAGLPLRAWRRWSARSRRVFVETLHNLTANWALLAPPSLELVGTKRARRTLAWNAAWLAADAAR